MATCVPVSQVAGSSDVRFDFSRFDLELFLIFVVALNRNSESHISNIIYL